MWFWRDEYLVLSCLASQSPPGHFYSKLWSDSAAPLLQRKARQTALEQQSRRRRESPQGVITVLPDAGLTLSFQVWEPVNPPSCLNYAEARLGLLQQEKL